jgi:hypothetical protein
MSWQTTFAESGTATDRYLGPARVLTVDHAEGQALVEIPGTAGAEPRWARIALPQPVTFDDGQQALVASAGEDAYVIGVLGKPVGGPVQVRNERNEVVFEYDAARRRSRVVVPSGDLDILVPDGDLTLASDRDVRVRGRTVDISATTGLRLAVHDLAARLLTSIGLSQRGTRLKTRTLEVDAVRTDVETRAGKVKADRLETEASLVRTRAERIETDADTVVERAGQLFQDVQDLLQTRAGRVRSLVAGAWHVRARRADLRTKDVFKVDGDRIHLG